MITLKNRAYHKLKEGDEYIGRPSVLGNPFTHKEGTIALVQVATRDEAVDMYEEWLNDQLAIGNKAIRDELNRLYVKARDGKLNLVCWCAPHRCHGEVIKKLIESKLQLVAQ